MHGIKLDRQGRAAQNHGGGNLDQICERDLTHDLMLTPPMSSLVHHPVAGQSKLVLHGQRRLERFRKDLPPVRTCCAVLHLLAHDRRGPRSFREARLPVHIMTHLERMVNSMSHVR